MRRSLALLAVAAFVLAGAESPDRASSTCSADPDSQGCATRPAVRAFANGDGKSDVGVEIFVEDYESINDLLEEVGPQLMPGFVFDADSGAKLFSATGSRIFDPFSEDLTSRVYVVPQGVHFVWPNIGVGSIVTPTSIETPSGLPAVRLKQLSDSPRVFQIQNFVRDEEIKELIEANERRMERSEVGFAGWKDDTRTSSTSWDYQSPAALILQKRAFSILGIDSDERMADALQVLSYEPGQWYKPHVDYFTPDGFDGAVPNENNGTNRFATVFVYLSDVDSGGSTVFPLSTSHEGYDGSYLVHPDTIKTPGYIDVEEAHDCCKDDSKALQSRPVRGNAVLFYSQTPFGELDPASLHGGCPPGQGSQTKWSANIWIWNRPKPDKSDAKDGPTDSGKKDDGGFHVSFQNDFPFEVHVKWDPSHMVSQMSDLKDLVEQRSVRPGKTYQVRTFKGHVFRALNDDNQLLWTARMPSDRTSSDPEMTLKMAAGNDYLG